MGDGSRGRPQTKPMRATAGVNMDALFARLRTDPEASLKLLEGDRAVGKAADTSRSNYLGGIMARV